MKVSIVIPNFNGESLLAKNLPKVLAAKENPKNAIVEILIVDDGSSDASCAVIKNSFPAVKLIKHTINRGFSASCNTGVRSSKGDLICLLNTDVVPGENFMESTLALFDEEKVFAVSLHEEGYGWAKGFFKGGFVEHKPGGESTNAHISFWASGGSAVFRRSIWTKLGGFDEKLFSPFYWEDIDLSYRALRRGYEILWDPNAHVVHAHESTVSKFPKRYVGRIRERNQLLFIWKNIVSASFFKKHLRAVIKRILRHPGYLIIFIMALSKISAVRRERKKEKKEARVSDEAIFARFT